VQDIEREKHFPLALVVGVQRSGTTWLQQLLSAHPQIAAGYESDLFSKYLKDAWDLWWIEQEARQRTGGMRGLATYVTIDEWAALLASVARGVFQNVLEGKPGAVLVAEKTPDNALHLPMVRSLFPRVKVVHIVRDARDVVASLLAASAKPWGAGWAPKDPKKAAETWVHWIMAARADAAAGPDLYLEVQYESLISDGPETLDRIFRFLEVPLTDLDTRGIYEAFGFEHMRAGTIPKTQILAGELRRDLDRAKRQDASHAAAKSTEQTATGQTEVEKLRAARRPPEGFYRQGTVGGWRQTLTNRQVKKVMSVATPLMIELGYVRPA
jgi:LPS sulfotransferase NodH